VIRDKTTDSYQVFTIENDVAHLRVVVVGDIDGDAIRIASGLNPTVTVATSHQGELFDGAPVTVGSR
jgi:hypothetical protein